MCTGPSLRLQDTKEYYRSGLYIELYHDSQALFFRIVTPLGVITNDRQGETGLVLAAAEIAQLITTLEEGLCGQLPIIVARDSKFRFAFKINAGADGDGYVGGIFCLHFELNLLAICTGNPEEIAPTLSITMFVHRKELDEVLAFLLFVLQSSE